MGVYACCAMATTLENILSAIAKRTKIEMDYIDREGVRTTTELLKSLVILSAYHYQLLGGVLSSKF